jgi:hypothetical protein
MRLKKVKRTVMATALAVATAVTGFAGQAQAFTFGQNDLVLAIYGNNTEALYNLGNANTILTSGGAGIVNVNVSAGLTAAQVGANPVKYTLFGWDLNLPNGQITAATAFAPSALTGTKDFNTQFNNSIGFSNLSFTGDTISKTDPQGRSFSQNLNVSGSGQFDGAWPLAMQGSLDQVLNVMRGNVETNTFTQVGRVLLTSGGLLTVGNPGPAAVPLPAAVVLFGTGLIGLIGVARRSFNKKAA